MTYAGPYLGQTATEIVRKALWADTPNIWQHMEIQLTYLTLSDSTRGRIFEEIVAAWLYHRGRFTRLVRYPGQDIGIDWIGEEVTGGRSAVQVKFRSKGTVSFRELSTFHNLCNRTGPYVRWLVVCNRNISGKCDLLPQDEILNGADLRDTARELWERTVGFQGQRLGTLRQAMGLTPPITHPVEPEIVELTEPVEKGRRVDESPLPDIPPTTVDDLRDARLRALQRRGLTP
jgi:hypothetical protein